MHDLDELKRQMQAAEDAAKTATVKAGEAKKKYLDAQFEATGFKGCIAETKNFRGEMVRFRPLAMGRWNFGGTEIAGYLLKKDGTSGERRFEAKVADCVNVGPYQPS